MIKEEDVSLQIEKRVIIDDLVKISNENYQEMVFLLDLCSGKRTELKEDTIQKLYKYGIVDVHGKIPYKIKRIIRDFYYKYLEWDEHLWTIKKE